jgi:hypothetical protein
MAIALQSAVELPQVLFRAGDLEQTVDGAEAEQFLVRLRFRTREPRAAELLAGIEAALAYGDPVQLDGRTAPLVLELVEVVEPADSLRLLSAACKAYIIGVHRWWA